MYSIVLLSRIMVSNKASSGIEHRAVLSENIALKLVQGFIEQGKLESFLANFLINASHLLLLQAFA